jgi:hypothetical protein
VGREIGLDVGFRRFRWLERTNDGEVSTSFVEFWIKLIRTNFEEI